MMLARRRVVILSKTEESAVRSKNLTPNHQRKIPNSIQRNQAEPTAPNSAKALISLYPFDHW
jgi:hypothetical protein